jgi:hypothetical protein
MGPTLFDETGEVLDERQDPGQTLLHGVGRQEEVGVEAPGEGVGPHPELLVVLGRHPEHLDDDLHGEGIGVVATRSHVPRSRAASSNSAQICSTRGRSSSTTRGVKAFCTSPRRRVWSGGSRKRKGAISANTSPAPVPAMTWRSRWPGKRSVVDVAAVAAGPLVPQNGQAVGVPGEDPEAEWTPMHGAALPQSGVDGIGVSDPGGSNGSQTRRARRFGPSRAARAISVRDALCSATNGPAPLRARRPRCRSRPLRASPGGVFGSRRSWTASRSNSPSAVAGHVREHVSGQQQTAHDGAEGAGQPDPIS